MLLTCALSFFHHLINCVMLFASTRLFQFEWDYDMCVCVCVGSSADFRLWMGLNNSKQTDNNSLHPRTKTHTHTYMQLFTAMFVRILASTFARLAGCLQNLCRLIVVGCGELLFLPLWDSDLQMYQTHSNTRKHTYTYAPVFALKRSRRASHSCYFSSLPCTHI